MKHEHKPSQMDGPGSYKTGQCHPEGNVHPITGHKLAC